MLHTLTNIILIGLGLFAIGYAIRNLLRGKKSEGWLWLVVGVLTLCYLMVDVTNFLAIFSQWQSVPALVKDALMFVTFCMWMYVGFIEPSRSRR